MVTTIKEMVQREIASRQDELYAKRKAQVDAYLAEEAAIKAASGAKPAKGAPKCHHHRAKQR